MEIQSVLFDKKYYDLKRAIEWMEKHSKLKIVKIDDKKNYIRFRQYNPKLYLKKSFRLKKINDGKIFHMLF